MARRLVYVFVCASSTYLPSTRLVFIAVNAFGGTITANKHGKNNFCTYNTPGCILIQISLPIIGSLIAGPGTLIKGTEIKNIKKNRRTRVVKIFP